MSTIYDLTEEERATMKKLIDNGLVVTIGTHAKAAKEATLWRDLVLLHPMDLMVIFGGSGSDEILLGKLQEWIEGKRGEKS